MTNLIPGRDIPDPQNRPSGGGRSTRSVVSPDLNYSTWIMPVQNYDEWNRGSFMYDDPRDHVHDGVDIYASMGAGIYSPVGGTILATGTTGAGGNWVQVRGDDGYVYYFAHMQYPTHLEAGSRVEAGTQLGMVGTSGNAAGTSPHLHFSMKTLSGDIVDPRDLLEMGMTLEQGATTSTSPSGSQPAQIPSGGAYYEVDGQGFVVFQIKGTDGAAASIYFRLEPGDTYPGSPQAISAQQWANMSSGMTNGGTSEAFADNDTTETWDELMERTLMEMGIWGTEAMSDPDVLGVIAAFIARPDMSPEELQTRLRETDWGQSRTEKQKGWDDKSEAQRNLDIVDTAANLIGVWFTYTGENLSMADYDLDGDGAVTSEELKKANPDLYDWSFKIASGAATQPMAINQWVKPVAEENENSPWSQTLRNVEIQAGEFDAQVKGYADEVMDMYEQYGIDMTWDEAVKMGHKIAMNDLTIAEVEQQVDEQAMALYPSKPKGMTTMSWASPYRNTMSTLLEIPDVGLSDPMLQRALSEGQTLGDFRKTLKSDERWMETKNARDEFNTTLYGLGNKLGF